ncbi:MAG TPA: glycosyltransferase family 39 protein [Longimicrobiales bacterium]
MRRDAIVLAAIVGAFAVAAAGAMRHTSTTFDEVLLPAAGARGYASGEFNLVTDHPPFLQYVYGLPVYLAGASYPPEIGWDYHSRYQYATTFYFASGNDPERIAFIGRLPGIVIGALLIVATFLFTRAAAGRIAGLLAAGLVAFLPDVLAHSGISYNDVPLALVVLLATWASDAAARDPRLQRIALAGAATGLALGVKFSGIVMGPITLLLVLLEGARRWPDREWLRRVLVGLPVFAAAAYLVLVAIYLGDFAIRDFWVGLDFNIRHANRGHGAPAVLLGRYSETGWWYFFPVAFFLKTSVGLHVLMLVALAGLLLAPVRDRWRDLATSPLRVPVVGGVVFLAFVMAANLNIGFRHALPLLPFVCILTAIGIARLLPLRLRFLRITVVAAFVWHILSPLRFYPFFMSYLSEYTGSVEYSYEALVDSSLDWGQGLLELRDFMEEEDIPAVLLSYFGSAPPAGYGIRYVALPSFFPLPPHPAPPGDSLPRWIAISATNLAGNYIGAEAFARFRDIEPHRVLARSIFVFRLEDE